MNVACSTPAGPRPGFVFRCSVWDKTGSVLAVRASRTNKTLKLIFIAHPFLRTATPPPKSIGGGTAPPFCMRPSLQRIQIDIPEVDFRAFRLKENLTACGERVGALICQLAVDVLPDMPVAVDQFDDIPLAVQLLHFVGRVAIAGNVLPLSLVEAVDLLGLALRACNAHAIVAGQRCSICHPEVARAALVDLKLHRPRPDLVRSLNVVENAAVASLAGARRKRAFSPLELGPQVVVLVLLLSDEIAHLRPRYVDDA